MRNQRGAQEMLDSRQRFSNRALENCTQGASQHDARVAPAFRLFRLCVFNATIGRRDTV